MRGEREAVGPSNRRDSDRLRRLESLRASEIPVDAINGATPASVQDALEALGALVAGGLVNAVDDAAAAAASVPVGGFYRNGSVVMVRVV